MQTIGRILITVLLSTALFIAIIFAGINALDGDRARRWVLPQIAKYTHLEIDVAGRIETKLSRYLHLELGSGSLLQSSERSASAESPSLTLNWQAVDIKIDPWELVFGRFAVDDIRIDTPIVTLNLRSAEKPVVETEQPPISLPVDIVLRDVNINDITVNLLEPGKEDKITLSKLSGNAIMDSGSEPPTLATDLELGHLVLHRPSSGRDEAFADTADALINTEISRGEEPKMPLTEKLYALLAKPPVLMDQVKIDIESAKLGKIPQKGVSLALLWTLETMETSLSFKEPQLRTSVVAINSTKQMHIEANLQNFAISPLINEAVQLEFLPASITTNMVTGTLRAKVDLVTQGDEIFDMLANLNGDIHAVLEEGSVDATLVEALGFDLAETAVSFFSDNPNTPLACMVAVLPIKNGIINGDQVIVITEDSRIKGQGSINLATRTIDYTLVTLAQDPSPLSIPAPIHLEGDLNSPKLSVETNKLLKEIATSIFQPAEALVEWIGGENDDPKQLERQNTKRCADEIFSH